ncbi:MAG: hypothetical protein WC707_00075 [Candidatus Babeliaceae bacterium]|jgi:hypothetical protein
MTFELTEGVAIAAFLCLVAASLRCGVLDYQKMYGELVGAMGNHTAFAAMYEKRRYAIENDPRPRCISFLLYHAMDQRTRRVEEEIKNWGKRVAVVREQGNSFQKATADFEWRRFGAGCAETTAALGLVGFCAHCAMNAQDLTLSWCVRLLAAGSTFFIYDGANRIASAMHYTSYLYEEWHKISKSYSVLSAEFVARKMYYDTNGHVRAPAENVHLEESNDMQDYQNIYEELVGVMSNHTAFAAMYEKRRYAIENDPRPRCISVLLKDAMVQRSNRASVKLKDWRKKIVGVRQQGNSFQKATADFEWRRFGAGCAEATAALGLVGFCAHCAMNAQDLTLSWCAGLLAAGSTFFIYDGANRIRSAMYYEAYLQDKYIKSGDSDGVLMGEFLARQMYDDANGDVRAWAENLPRY